MMMYNNISERDYFTPLSLPPCQFYPHNFIMLSQVRRSNLIKQPYIRYLTQLQMHIIQRKSGLLKHRKLHLNLISYQY